MSDRNGLDFKHLDITSRIVEVFFEVYGELGYGFLESVYRSAMGMALREAGLQVETELHVQALFRAGP